MRQEIASFSAPRTCAGVSRLEQFSHESPGGMDSGGGGARCDALLLAQLQPQLSSGFGITPALDEEVQAFALIVHCVPESIAFPPDHDDHFIEVPVIAGTGTG